MAVAFDDSKVTSTICARSFSKHSGFWTLKSYLPVLDKRPKFGDLSCDALGTGKRRGDFLDAHCRTLSPLEPRDDPNDPRERNAMNLTWKRAALGALVLFIVGFGIGQSQSETKKVVVTLTETETTKRAPAACATALDYAAEGFGRVADLSAAVGRFNIEEIEDAADGFSQWATSNQADLARATGECRAAVR